MSATTEESRATENWRLLPVVALRQSGFGFELLEPYSEPGAVAEALRMTGTAEQLRKLAPALKDGIKAARLSDNGAAASAVGTLRPLSDETFQMLAGRLPCDAVPTLRAYQEHAHDLSGSWLRWEETHEERMHRAKAVLRDVFRHNGLLRDALLLSNEANFGLFASWLDGPEGVGGPRGRKMTDLLIRYLQRVTTKNETASHFGPLSVGLIDRSVRGVSWERKALRRRVFLAHWAAERLAGALGADPVLAARVRPRRRPWAFERDGVVTLYEFTTEDGFSVDWRFRKADQVELTPVELEVFRRCDGSTTVAELEGDLGAEAPGALASLVARRLVVDRFEVPVGVTEPLAELRLQAGSVEPVERLARDLAAIPEAELGARPSAVGTLKESFAEITGAEANRGTGMHYADRSVFYEECHGPVGDLRLGADVAELIENELAPVYALAFAVPRLRIVRERELLTRWVTRRFGTDTAVPLDRFYAEYFADRDELLKHVDEIDAELDALDADLTALLLGDDDLGATEVVVDPERLNGFLERCPDGPPALVNPDVMLAAPDPDALLRGDFLAVVGDCHGTRELLSHSSFAPLIAEEYPRFTADATAAYRELVDEDETLCDLARSHPDKTASRSPLDMPDLEIYGRSSLTRDQVIQPSSLYLKVSDGQLNLYADGVPGRLRLLAPPSGGPTVRLDPLAPFAFPRRLGGLVLEAGLHTHVPRIRTGRIVLQRELWRIPVSELVGQAPDGKPRKGNAAEFFAACELRRRHGLPRHAFVKFDSEPKPLYVDFTSPLLVRQMFRLAHGASGPATFSEMLPGPEQLWLHRDGQKFTTELRCAVSTASAVPTAEK
ncbi:lantibiotic dehydratase [Streptomyces sp. NBC_01408]|uniref:lantibiotic dehydratase n=1 Tax=Streptomyces sp. NBC_01408 TaxID=2903855 RepID=UPI002250A0F2|nr:lantibiotic dehydratase [Streptomyces sp. NBC_01408]MCX4692892.1 lantibiotic dehydratase family protein [Streptomyces sp. NBC_01408]